MFRTVLSAIFYAMRISEVDAPTVGMVAVKVPAVDVIVPPKSKIATARLDTDEL